MIDATTLASLIDSYFNESETEPTPTELANYIVSKYFGILSRQDEDPAILLRGAIMFIEGLFLQCKESRIVIDHVQFTDTVLVEGRDTEILCRGRTLSDALMQFAMECATRS